jgi:serine/threonine protein kinase
MSTLLSTSDVSVEALVGQVADEFVQRVNRGEQPGIEEYARRYPEIACVLREVLAALQFMRLPLGSVAGADAPGIPDTPVRGCLGDFCILREVGRGGMGVVYEAEQISLNRRVALKVLPFAAALDPKQLQRFKNEAQTAAGLHHQHIVPVYGVGCERGVHYYAMQFIEGQTLAAFIREMRHLAGKEHRGSRMEDRGLPGQQNIATKDALRCDKSKVCTGRSSILYPRSSIFRTVAQLGRHAAEALGHAHSLGIVHRDIKPANLLVDVRGNLWVTDFGLARFRDQAGLTLSGDLLGTLRYMSPEQALAKHGLVDHRTDVYALGATLYELLTLEPVCPGDDRHHVLRQIEHDDPRPPRSLNPAIPGDLETIVLKALAKEAEARYATAQDLADDLGRFLEDKPIRARRPTLVQRARKWARRHKALVVAGQAVLLLAVVAWAVSTMLILRQRDAARDQRQRAVRAVNDMYTEVAKEWLAHQPRMEKVQLRFLVKALQYYEEFAAEPGADPALRHQAGLAARRVGDMQARLAAPADAEGAYGKAIRIQAGLAAGFPDVPEYRQELAASLNGLAVLQLGRGRLREAKKTLLQALQVQGLGEHVLHAVREGKEPAVDFPAEPRYPGELARSLNSLGELWARTSRRQAAERAYRQAGALLERLELARHEPRVKQSPGATESRLELARNYHLLAYLLTETGKTWEAVEQFRQAVAIEERLVEEFPSVAYRLQLAQSRRNLANALIDTGGGPEAERILRQLVKLLETLRVEIPDLPECAEQLARSYRSLGYLLWDTAGPREAAPALHQARAVFEELATRHRDVLAYTQQLV